MKKFFAIAIFLLCLNFAFASTSITNYIIPSNVPLGDVVTATGVLNDTNGTTEGYLCNFYFLDDQNVLIKRATDQYTTSTGRFTMVNFVPTEPTFKRDHNYTVLSECKGATASATFLLGNFETISQPASQNFAWLTHPENTDTFFIWGALILFLGIFVIGIISLFKWGVRR
jgi:hypothetical protein